mgnify:CR=1 FL=1
MANKGRAYYAATILAAAAARAGNAVIIKIHPAPYTAQHGAYPGLVGHNFFLHLCSEGCPNSPLIAVFSTWARVLYCIPVVV